MKKLDIICAKLRKQNYENLEEEKILEGPLQIVIAGENGNNESKQQQDDPPASSDFIINNHNFNNFSIININNHNNDDNYSYKINKRKNFTPKIVRKSNANRKLKNVQRQNKNKNNNVNFMSTVGEAGGINFDALVAGEAINFDALSPTLPIQLLPKLPCGGVSGLENDMDDACRSRSSAADEDAAVESDVSGGGSVKAAQIDDDDLLAFAIRRRRQLDDDQSCDRGDWLLQHRSSSPPPSGLPLQQTEEMTIGRLSSSEMDSWYTSNGVATDGSSSDAQSQKGSSGRSTPQYAQAAPVVTPLAKPTARNASQMIAAVNAALANCIPRFWGPECGAEQCQLLSAREHFHCKICDYKLFTKKEEMLRHFKWHKKREESMALGFLRFSATDDCVPQFGPCVHNLRQTHYHCMQNGCDKVYISTSDVQMHANSHRKADNIAKEGFRRFKSTENCGFGDCPFLEPSNRTTHFHCIRPGCCHSFKNKADMDKHKTHHQRDELYYKDGFKKFMKCETCTFPGCALSRLYNHTHCLRKGCGATFQSTSQIHAHKRKHEKQDKRMNDYYARQNNNHNRNQIQNNRSSGFSSNLTKNSNHFSDIADQLRKTINENMQISSENLTLNSPPLSPPMSPTMGAIGDGHVTDNKSSLISYQSVIVSNNKQDMLKMASSENLHNNKSADKNDDSKDGSMEDTKKSSKSNYDSNSDSDSGSKNEDPDHENDQDDETVSRIDMNTLQQPISFMRKIDAGVSVIYTGLNLDDDQAFNGKSDSFKHNISNSGRGKSDESWKRYITRYTANDRCLTHCPLMYKDHYHCTAGEGCIVTFRSKDGVRDHAKQHECLTIASGFYKVCEENEHCDYVDCVHSGKGKHYHCLLPDCSEVIGASEPVFRRLEHHKFHEYSLTNFLSMAKTEGTAARPATSHATFNTPFIKNQNNHQRYSGVCGFNGDLRRKRGRPPKYNVLDLNVDYSSSSPTANSEILLASFKLAKSLNQPSRRGRPRTVSSPRHFDATEASKMVPSFADAAKPCNQSNILTFDGFSTHFPNEPCPDMDCKLSNVLHVHCRQPRCFYRSASSEQLESHAQDFHQAFEIPEGFACYDKSYECRNFGFCEQSGRSRHFHCLTNGCNAAFLKFNELSLHGAKCGKPKFDVKSLVLTNQTTDSQTDSDRIVRTAGTFYPISQQKSNKIELSKTRSSNSANPTTQTPTTNATKLSVIHSGIRHSQKQKAGSSSMTSSSATMMSSSQQPIITSVRVPTPQQTLLPPFPATSDLINPASLSHPMNLARLQAFATAPSFANFSAIGPLPYTVEQQCGRPFCKLKRREHFHCSYCSQGFSHYDRLVLHMQKHCITLPATEPTTTVTFSGLRPPPLLQAGANPVMDDNNNISQPIQTTHFPIRTVIDYASGRDKTTGSLNFASGNSKLEPLPFPPTSQQALESSSGLSNGVLGVAQVQHSSPLQHSQNSNPSQRQLCLPPKKVKFHVFEPDRMKFSTEGRPMMAKAEVISPAPFFRPLTGIGPDLSAAVSGSHVIPFSANVENSSVKNPSLGQKAKFKSKRGATTASTSIIPAKKLKFIHCSGDSVASSNNNNNALNDINPPMGTFTSQPAGSNAIALAGPSSSTPSIISSSTSPCSSTTCELNGRTPVHFHCQNCQFWATDSTRLAVHTKQQHSRCDRMAALGFQKVFPGSSDRLCPYESCPFTSQSHYHCLQCGGIALNQAEMEAHKENAHNNGEPLPAAEGAPISNA